MPVTGFRGFRFLGRPEQEATHGKLQRMGANWISGSISFQKELSIYGTWGCPSMQC